MTGFPPEPPHGFTALGTQNCVTMASAADAEAAGEGGTPLLLNQPVVIDNGTASIKAGFAGSSKPKVREKSARRRVYYERDEPCRFSLSILYSARRECFSICAFQDRPTHILLLCCFFFSGHLGDQSGSGQAYAHHAGRCLGSRPGAWRTFVHLCRTQVG
jgi:hypothetical protein